MNIDVEQVVREYIDKSYHMSLATASGDAPWVCEVHFAYDDDLNLYWRSLSTRRHSEEIAANPKVSGTIIDKYVLGESVVGVYFEGNAELLGPGEEQDKAAECIKQRLKTTHDTVEEAAKPEGHQFYKTTVTNWYVFGRFGGDNGQKFKLEWNGGKKK
jgi:uncharacterized protein YhbP (UPF0306 family)